MTDGTGEAERALAERAMSLRKLYYVDLATFAVRLGSSVTDARTFADDAVAELVMRPLKRPGQDPVRNESAWLYRTVRYMVMSARRHQQRFDNEDIQQLGDRLRQTTWGSPDLHLEVDIPVNAAEQRVSRGRRRLPAKLEGRDR
ncbi:sigma-70 family RNA polymerase sigma factor [Amycolatopsis sp. NPDC098790]|uniref:sigma-70 family RNA polymerase sigma factor n=1 Tax=Amycolatopsis sp. NPDC098790 TaxID=3363939 RepID=UPI0038017391